MSAESDPAEEELVRLARELYAVVPAEFVAARNTRAAELRSAGDRDTAARVAALPKPTAPAWAVAAVVRDHPAELAELSQLGAELRVAQASGNARELRELSRRRRRLTDRVASVAAAAAEARGVVLSPAGLEQVAATWHAVVIDRTAERAVRSGLLVRPLEPGAVDLAAALALPVVGTDSEADDDGVPATSRTPGSEGGAEGTTGEEEARTEAAERALVTARHAATVARQEAAAAAEARAQVEAEVLRAAASVEEARRELAAREAELAALDERGAVAREKHEAAQARREEADAAVDRARETVGDPPRSRDLGRQNE